jgi:hypothetical protein
MKLGYNALYTDVLTALTYRRTLLTSTFDLALAAIETRRLLSVHHFADFPVPYIAVSL